MVLPRFLPSIAGFCHGVMDSGRTAMVRDMFVLLHDLLQRLNMI